MLLVLDNTSRKLVADQSMNGMVNCNVTVTYADHDGTTFVEGINPSTLNGTNKVVILDSPPSGVRRVIKSITFYNSSTDVHQITLYLQTAVGMYYPITSLQLSPGSSWSSDDQTGVNVGALTPGVKGDINVVNLDDWQIVAGAVGNTEIANGAVGTSKLGQDITTAGKALLDDADAAAQRTTLGLGSFATASSVTLDTGGTGDATGTLSPGGSNVVTLKTVNANVGQFGSTTNIPVVTVNAKGLVTAVSTAAISIPPSSLNFTGEVTGNGSTGGNTALTISNKAVTYAKIQDVSDTNKLLGRSSLGAGSIEEITCTPVARNFLAALDAAAQRTVIGAYAASNPNGYTNNTGTVTSVSGSGSVNGITLSGSGNSVVALTLGGTLTGVNLSTQVTGTLPVANGGTGATTAANARANLGAAAVTGTVVPSADSGTGSIGTSTEAARADHVHPAGAGGGRELLTANRTYYVGFNIPGTCSFTSANPTVVTLTNHGLSAGTPVVFTAPSGSTVPTGLIPGAIYYVKDNTTNQTNTFQIALIPGGTSIATTSTGSGLTCRTGNDTNNGLTLSRTGALLTPQRAIELLGGIDMGAYNVIIQLANGRYTDCVEFYPFLGSGTVTLQGDTTTWTNVVLEPYSCGNVGYSTSTGLFTNFGTSGSTPTPHNFIDGTPISINTFLALPVGLVPRKTYYVQNVASSGANAFQIWTAPVGGSRVQPTTTGSGTYGGNFCIYGDSYSSKYILRGLTIGGSIRGYSIGIFNAPLDITQCHFAGSPNKWAHLYAGGGAKIAFVDNWSVGVGGDEGCFFSDASYVTARTSACTITTSFTSNHFFSATRAGVILADAATYINPTLMTGSRGRASINGVLRGSSTALPGSTGPTSDYSTGGGGQYQDAG